MQGPQSAINISVIWRGKKFVVEMHSEATLKELGHKLLEFANVKADTMRLIVPQYSNKSSKLLSPFSDEHSGLSLQEISVLEGKPIRMMGASEVEVDEVLQGARADLRIAGFDEEEKRLKQRMSEGPHASLKLPQGTYIFCDFRTLQIPGIELNPPPSEALKRMHMLAADPGIVAIMNKHRWRVGIMTELAPVGYVGVSPKCILGFNKNHGEEISLRLRTDDLKGFRKYESIKKTLLHELAHMIYSEHGANFYALDKQLNQEAASLDWTRSRSHTLSGVGRLEHSEEEFYVGDSSKFSQKLGGSKADQLASARASSVAAAYHRIASASANSLRAAEVHEEPDPDDSGFNMHEEPDLSDSLGKELNDERPSKAQENFDHEPDPDDCLGKQNNCEPDPDDSQGNEMMETEQFIGTNGKRTISEQDFDDIEMTQYEPPSTKNSKFEVTKMSEEPDPDDSEVSPKYGIVAEPDPDDSEVLQKNLDCEHISRPDQGGSPVTETMKNQGPLRKGYIEPDPDDSLAKRLVQAEPDPDLNDNLVRPTGTSGTQTEEPDPDDQELQRIQDPVTVVCSRLQKAIKILRSEVNPTEASNVLQTLFKIIRNVIEHPDEIKFKRLRKENPIIQRNVANYKAAMEILNLIGFIEDVVLDEIGKAETYLVLKRNDPGLLWLVKSSLETCIAY